MFVLSHRIFVIAILCLIVVPAAAPVFAQPLADEGVITITPIPDADLVIVREQSYGSGGVDLTTYGIGTGPVDYVQSIYFRTYTGGDAGTPASLALRVEFPEGVAILGIITDGVSLGGSSDDGTATETDLLFGVAADPDDYSENLRGFETGGGTGSSEFIGITAPNVFVFALNVTQGVDDFRVIIDYGNSFPADLSFDVTQLGIDQVGGASISDGIQVGVAGGVPGSGDHGEVASLSGIPLTTSDPPVAGGPIARDPHSNLYILRNTLAGHVDGYDVFYDVPWQSRFILALGSEEGITDGTDGMVYAVDRNGNLARIDPLTETVEHLSAPDLTGNILGLTASEGTTDLFLLRDTSGPTWVDRLELSSLTYVNSVEIASTEIANPRGITDGPDGLLYVLSSTGKIVAIDPNTGSQSTVADMAPPSGSYAALTAFPGRTRLLYLIRDTNSNSEVDTWNVYTGMETYSFASLQKPASPSGIADGPGDLIYAVGSGGGYASIDPVTGQVYVTHDAFDFGGSNVAVTAFMPNFAPTSVAHSNYPAIRMNPPYPNPFNPATRLTFELPAPGHVRLSVHDPTGRLVAVLVDDFRNSGLHGALWNGRDRTGNRVASGVYFSRLETSGTVVTQKLVLVK